MTSQEKKNILPVLSKNFGLPDLSASEFSKFRELLIDRIDDLLNHDFSKLIWVLYRVDVSEHRANELLALHPNQPAEVLADLCIERQIQKYNSRKNFKADTSDTRDDDLRM